MRVGTIHKRTIIRQVVILGACVAFGWFLKGRLTPQMGGMGGMGGGTPYVLTQKLSTRNIFNVPCMNRLPYSAKSVITLPFCGS